MVALAFISFLKRFKRRGIHGTRAESHEAHSHSVFDAAPVDVSHIDPEPVTTVPVAVPSTGVEEQEKAALAHRVKELEQKTRDLEQKNLAMHDKNRKMKENIEAYREKHKKAKRAAGQKASVASTTGGIPGKNKRSGKPRGKRGAGFKVPSTIDRVVEWRLDTCPRCGKSLKESNPIDHREHVIIDVKNLHRGTALEHVKHVINRYRCPGCNQLVAKHFGKLSHAHYGLGLISLVMEERVARHGSWDEIQGTLIRFLSHPDDETSIPTIVAFIDWMRKWEPEIRIVYDAFVAAVKGTEFAHVDETGLPLDGRNWWLWVVVTANVVLFKASDNRGHTTIKDMFEGYKGILISDFWSAYNKLSVEQQKCLAHLVKDLRVIATDAGSKQAKIKKALDAFDAAAKAASEGAAPAKPRGRPPKAPEPITVEQQSTLVKDVEQQAKVVRQAMRLHEFFSQAWGDGDMGWKTPMEKRITIKEAMRRLRALITELRTEGIASPDIERLLKRAEKFGRKLFTYLEHDGIPPDNNRAERAIRPFVMQRKVSGNFVNPLLADIYAMLLSLYHTTLNKKLKVRDVFKLLFEQDTDGILQLLGLPVPEPAPPDPPATALA
jgi:rubrerythrin